MDPPSVPAGGPGNDATDPLRQGLAFESRLGRPAGSWRRALKPFGIVYCRHGLRVRVALTCSKGDHDQAEVTLMRGDGRKLPDLAQIAAVRQDFFPLDVAVSARWAFVAGKRVLMLEATVPADWEAMRHAS